MPFTFSWGHQLCECPPGTAHLWK